MWQSARITSWLSGDKIRPLQVAKRVTDHLYKDGWQTFVGLDFSHGDDLFAITYLSVDYKPSDTMEGRFFADCEAWVLESTMKESPNRALYELWVEQGWLKVCPGEVFNPDYAINDLMAKNQQGINMTYFGYDPAQSKQPINTLKAWLQSLGIDGATIEQMVVSVAQTFMVFNGLIIDLESWILSPQPWLYFSESPLWPWCFGNAVIEESREGNRKVLKATPTQKVDPVHALIDALYCFNLSESKIEK